MMKEGSFFHKYILRINRDELLFDILLYAYTEFFLYRFVTGGKWFVQVLSMKSLLVAGVFLDFFIIWYLGTVFREYRAYYRNAVIYVAYCIAALWIVIALHLGVVMNVFDIFGRGDFIVMSVFGYLLVMVGIAGGVVFAATEVQRGKGRPVAAARLRALKIVVPFGMWAMNIYLVYHLLESLNMRSFLVGIPLWVLFTFLEYYLFSFFEKRVKKKVPEEPRPSRFDRIFRSYLFPVIVVTLLCLWDEIFLWGSITRALSRGETISLAGTIAYLTLAGIVPMRIILVFQPPLNLVNLAVGAGSMGYFLYSVAMLLKSVFV
ncbi:MAG TPA: hypothetical protein PLC28_04445 [Spirochaetota bacterium]|nr:hypothetical protein [Spirochaetota bacterium]HPC42213.1 hypothetical protein [Spirochaetota bacterium]HPL16579.1 hypothetical protein [Spirochaetota bacterium]HQJ70078.1 hypothetical protein [Spirochaetota bacterium]HRS76796.1 hypothetical protein [Spirochaetota bacterium]